MGAVRQPEDLPAGADVRATETFGGRSGAFTSSAVTNVTWLPPTRANTARALRTIPPGFHRWPGSPGNQ